MRRGEVVAPEIGGAGGVPLCPVHARPMKLRAMRGLESGLTHIWWWCMSGDCTTCMVPVPAGSIPNLGPE